jgi:hypothetical protein
MKKYLYALVTIGFILTAGYLVVLGTNFKNNIRAYRAEKIGHLYIEKVYKEYVVLGEICQGVDTDDNGYVSCTFRLSKENTEKEINLQCPTYIKSFLGNECKASQMVMSQ